MTEVRFSIAATVGVLATALSFAAPVFGADPKDQADALFREGRRAFEAGDYETACAKLAESQRVEGSPATLFNLAYCEEKRGLLVSAWKHYREGYLQMVPRDDRQLIAKKWLADLEARLPRLTVRLAPGSPAGARVAIGGIEIPANSVLSVRNIRLLHRHQEPLSIAAESREHHQRAQCVCCRDVHVRPSGKRSDVQFGRRCRPIHYQQPIRLVLLRRRRVNALYGVWNQRYQSAFPWAGCTSCQGNYYGRRIKAAKVTP